MYRCVIVMATRFNFIFLISRIFRATFKVIIILNSVLILFDFKYDILYLYFHDFINKFLTNLIKIVLALYFVYHIIRFKEYAHKNL